jgi:glutamate N-acetyltransferase / amino-acid N-acetyltransferase
VATRVETFFRSRWVERPERVVELEPGRLPAGFRAAAVATGSKPSGKLDVAALACDDDAVSVGLFTRNAVVGAPVKVSRRAQLDRLRAVVVNAGNANVGTGDRGVGVAETMVRVAADTLGVEPARVGVASTGIIGVQLDEEAIVGGVRAAVGSLGPEGGRDFSEAILTSDRGPKRASLEVSLSSGAVVLAAQAKGAGMISPDFATMLCFVETDAAVDPATLERMVRGATAVSFERITVDGQLSTSDSLFVFAGGASGHAVAPGSDDERAFAAALDALFRQLALEIVADGEGAMRVARLVVTGPESALDPVARAVANSPLVKAALHGGDPNWGRILQAAGQALPEGSGDLDLAIEGVALVNGGNDLDLSPADRDRLNDAMRGAEVEIRLDLPGGDAVTELFFCDLAEEYVRFNSEYST